MIKILVIEDNNTMRLGITETLERVDFKVFPFSNGPEALEFLKTNIIDIAPTISALLGISFPNGVTGNVLEKAID